MRDYQEDMYQDRNARSSKHVYRWNHLWVFRPEELVSPALMSCPGEGVEGECDCEAGGDGEEEREEAEEKADSRPCLFAGDVSAEGGQVAAGGVAPAWGRRRRRVG